MKYGYSLLVVVLVAFFSYGVYSTKKFADNVVGKRNELITSLLNNGR